MDPTRLIIKVVVQKGSNDKPYAMVSKIGFVSYHLGSLLGALELTIFCVHLYT